MFLKRIEINGFKSFAGKTVLEFPSSTVAIVGPNGSGKSNIVDAIKWVLGEREAKNLRGDKADDLIFSGTPKKPRVSMASVSMVFDNSNNDMQLDFNEIVVTRKIARTGTSEYFINDSKVRLKDIINLFSKIRVGSRGLTIISQGAADLFVSSSDEKRMDMIKEVLGLKEFELKKHEAKLKLQNTLSQIEKINAMMQEVAPRLRLLKRQAIKFNKRKEIEENLKDIEKNYYAYMVLDILNEKERAVKQMPDLEMRLKEKSIKLKELQKKLEYIEKDDSNTDALSEINKKKTELIEKKSKLEREMFRIEAEERVGVNNSGGNIDVNKYVDFFKTVKNILVELLEFDNINKIKLEIKKLLSKAEEVNFVESKNNKPNGNLKEEKAKITENIKEIEKEINKLILEESDISEKSNTFRNRFKQAFISVEREKEEIRKIEDAIRNIKFEVEKLEYKEDEIKRNIKSAGQSYDDIIVYAKSVGVDKLRKVNEDFGSLEHKIIRLRNELYAIGEIDDTIMEEYKKVEEHYEFLKKEYEDLVSASSDLKKMIVELEAILRERFKMSFGEVNIAFSEYFKVMFGGGQAKLKLVKAKKSVNSNLENDNKTEHQNIKENDSEESIQGIAIELTIPGKKSHSLESLSGGERSLVSLAALFAIVSIGRPPFLVLDEADAALDEKNSNRFAQLIKRFSENTQFILITHNRTMMEDADILYGITMEDGVSKVLSLKLEE